MIGDKISHYKILEKLGQGGMGEVYKALDTKLDRLVALKFIAPQFSGSEEEKKRFIKEAKAASSLNHPNICTIYDIQEYEDPQFMKQLFMVMEYVEGKTIKNLDKELPINVVIDIGIQIAEGLAAAHEKGIIHRDIKPENIMLRKDGRVQVMDFGLAKLYCTSEVSRLTKSGTTMGTLGYMSPEQVEGLEVDYRSDIFSAGVVLYELLAGESPFKGIHDAAVIYKIVNSEAPPLSSIRKDIDPLLDLIILKCLEKDKERRYQSSKEFADDLRNIKKIYEGEDLKHIVKIKRKLFPKLKPIRRTSISPSGSIKIEKVSKKYIWIGLAIFLLITAGFYEFFFAEQTIEINPDMKIHELVTPYNDISNSSISADGNWIAFPACDQNGNWDVYLMHSNSGESRRITYDSTSFVRFASISPDGSRILYTIFDKQDLYIISSTTGNKKKLAEGVNFAAWRPDGKQIGYLRENNPEKNFDSFWTMNPDGSNKRFEFKDKGLSLCNISFSFSTDGKSVVWLRQFKGGYGELIVKELGSGKEKQLTFDKKYISDLYWTKRGVILFLSGKSGNMNTYLIPEIGGKEVQITKGSGPDVEVTASEDLNKILTFQSVNYSNTFIKNLKTYQTKQITLDERLITYPSFSPDGKLIAYSQYNAFAEWSHVSEIFVMNKQGNDPHQITSDNSVDMYVLFSPDGKYIAYTQIPVFSSGDTGKVFIVKPDGSESPRFITKGRAWMWADNNSLVVDKNPSNEFPMNTEIISIDGKVRKRIYKDSTAAFPVDSGRSIFYIDMHHDKMFKVYQISANYKKEPEKYTPHYLPDINYYFQFQINQNYFYWYNNKEEIWRYNYRSGKAEKIGNYPNIIHYWGWGFAISQDDKELVYLPSKRRSKMLLIENAILEK